jgi:dienelactone hydrolase
MSEIVMFHHSQGLTDGVKSFAEELRQAGHTVHLPDLYEGRTFATLDDGMGYARETGFDTILARGVKAGEELGDGLVYIGHSLGVVPAQQLAQTRPGAKAAVFLYSCLPVSEFGSWPTGVPVQIHGMDGDPFFTEEGGDLDAARELVAGADQAELFLYPGTDHLFADTSLPAYDEGAATLLRSRVLSFLGAIS